MTTSNAATDDQGFIVTKEHRRFLEFARAVRQHRYIGLCYGAAGVGKTLSARRYANWNKLEPLLEVAGSPLPADVTVQDLIAKSRAVFHTAPVLGAPREMRDRLGRSTVAVSGCIAEHLERGGVEVLPHRRHRLVELLIIDEAERLQYSGLEMIRDIFDLTGVAVILIGMPGMEKRLARYPQLYSRVGFAHHYRPLQNDELTFVLTRHWRQLGLFLDDADFTDTQAVASIARITGGNFRLLQRLFVQIARILKINGLSVITDDVVEAARSTLVIGAI